MKINCNEGVLAALSTRGCFVKEGRLSYRKESKKYFKDRWFKLRANLLFYYKTNDFGIICEDEPRGCLILTRYALKEEFIPNALFAFSITFHGSGEKHYFAGQSTEHCKAWVDALRSADMDIIRQELLHLRSQLSQRNPRLKPSYEIAPPVNKTEFKKANKPLNNIPKRLEKKIASVDDKSKRDAPKQPTSAFYIPQFKSSSALEQVRKSYSLASLMLDPLTCNMRHGSSSNKSTFFVDRKNFLGSMASQDGFCHSLDAFTSSRKNSMDSYHQFSYPRSELPLADSAAESEILSDDYANLLRHKNTRPRDATARHIFKSGDLQPCQGRRSSMFSVMLPLALVSDPFTSTFVKPTGHANHSCTAKHDHEEDSMKNQDKTEVNGIYRRPRSCTLAQLESIPAHLLGQPSRDKVIFSIGDEKVTDTIGVQGQASKSKVSKDRDRNGFHNWETFDD